MFMRTLILISAILLCAAACAKPVIGISTDVGGHDPEHGHIGVGSQYVDAITSAGGIPLLLPSSLDLSAIPNYVKMCDGFVMTGGRDISPARYGDTTVSTYTELMNPRREQFDFALIDAILAAKKPVLGICLGSQELNVATGGALFQDLPTETTSTINHKPGGAKIVHEVAITTGTRLHDLLGTTTLQVNSIHHQACKSVGKDVLVAARAPDDVIESFQVKNQPFALGIQWHPEALRDTPEQLKIYEALVKAAEEHKQ